jgi:hypothetical protein
MVKGFSSLSLVIYIAFLSIIFSFVSIVSPELISRKSSDQYLQNCAIQLDAALSVYYSSHNKQYPTTIQDLIALNHLPDSFPIDSFEYEVNEDLSAYKASVKLSDKSIFVSPNSKL